MTEKEILRAALKHLESPDVSEVQQGINEGWWYNGPGREGEPWTTPEPAVRAWLEHHFPADSLEASFMQAKLNDWKLI